MRRFPHPSTPPTTVLAPPTRPPLSLFIAVALAFFWRYGYGFGESDHDDFLPELYRLLDPDLYPTDPFVQERAGAFSVRAAFLYGLRVLCVVLPPPVAVALVYVGVFVAVTWGVWRLGSLIVPDRLGVALGTFAAVVLTTRWTLGGNALVYDYLVPEGVAWALIVPALALFAERRRMNAALLVGVATWFQALAGLLTAGALGLAALMETMPRHADRRTALWRAVRFGALFVLAAAPMLGPMLWHQAGETADPDGLSGFYLYARLRVPHHYLPSAFPPGAWLRFGLVVLAGGAGFLALRRTGWLRHGAFVAHFFVAVALLCGMGAVAVLGFESLTAARLQPFKLTVLAAMLLTLGAAGGAVQLLPDTWHRRLSAALDARWTTGVLAVLLLATAGLAGAGVGPAAGRYRPAVHAASDLGRVEAWARSHTPIDALVAVPPTNTTFRVGARRGVVVTWKSFPFRLDRMQGWLERLRAVAPAPLPGDGRGFAAVLDSAYFANPPEAWTRMADALGADYALLDTTRTPTPPATEPVYRSGPWALYPLQP